MREFLKNFPRGILSGIPERFPWTAGEIFEVIFFSILNFWRISVKIHWVIPASNSEFTREEKYAQNIIKSRNKKPVQFSGIIW